MTKAELIERVYSRKQLPRDLTKKTVSLIVDAVFTEMGDYFIRSRLTRNQTAKLTYPGFGTFAKKRRGGRVVKSFNPGAPPITIPPQETVTFSPGQELRGLLNRQGKQGNQGVKANGTTPHGNATGKTSAKSAEAQ
jgi:nucleoid DNA-binding protein